MSTSLTSERLHLFNKASATSSRVTFFAYLGSSSVQHRQFPSEPAQPSLRIADQRLPFPMQTLRQDIAYALRQMRLSPVFTLTAMVTLALGIGATTAIFSLINTVMLKSLPVVDPSSLYRIGVGQDCCVEGSTQDNWGMFSYPFYEVMQKNTPEFEQLAAFQAGGWSISVRRGRNRPCGQTTPAKSWSYRQLLRDLRPRRLRRTHAHPFRRSALIGARRDDQLSHLAATVRL